VERMAEIIEKERPDALLPNLGGQTGLNLSSALARRGVLDKYGVQVIGVPVDAIERGEDRQVFKDTMNRLGVELPRSEIAAAWKRRNKSSNASACRPWSGPPIRWEARAVGWSITWTNSAR